MKLYLAHWATPEDLDAERDDSQFDCVADMAQPSGVVLRSRSKATIKKLLQLAYDDAFETAGGKEHLDEEEQKEWRRYVWRSEPPLDMSDRHPSRRFFSQHHNLVDPLAPHEDDAVLTVIVRNAFVI